LRAIPTAKADHILNRLQAGSYPAARPLALSSTGTGTAPVLASPAEGSRARLSGLRRAADLRSTPATEADHTAADAPVGYKDDVNGRAVRFARAKQMPGAGRMIAAFTPMT